MAKQLLVLVIAGLAVTALTQAPCNGPAVRCITNPCTSASCPAFANAVCRANYCGGCNAEFFIRGVRVSKQDCSSGFGEIESQFGGLPLDYGQMLNSDYGRFASMTPPQTDQIRRPYGGFYDFRGFF